MDLDEYNERTRVEVERSRKLWDVRRKMLVALTTRIRRERTGAP